MEDTAAGAPSSQFVDRTKSLVGAMQVQIAELILEDRRDGFYTGARNLRMIARAILKREGLLKDGGSSDHETSRARWNEVINAFNRVGGDPAKTAMIMDILDGEALEAEVSDLLARIPEEYLPLHLPQVDELIKGAMVERMKRALAAKETRRRKEVAEHGED